MLFLSKTIIQKCLLLLKWPILAVSAQVEIQIFQISSKNSFITSTTGLVEKSEEDFCLENISKKSQILSFCHLFCRLSFSFFLSFKKTKNHHFLLSTSLSDLVPSLSPSASTMNETYTHIFILSSSLESKQELTSMQWNSLPFIIQ